MSSGAFDAYLELADNGSPRRVFASDDSGAGGTDALIRAILPVGTYVFGASSATPGGTGAYTLAPSALEAGNVLAQCAVVWAVRGITVTETLSSTDCHLDGGPGGGTVYMDRVRLYLRAGESVTIDQASSTFFTFLYLFGPQGWVVDNPRWTTNGMNSRIVYTAATTGIYVVAASSYEPRTTGTYTLSVR